MMAEQIDSGITKWSKYGAVFFAGWLAASAYHHTAVTDYAAKQLPKLAAAVNCEHVRADKVEKLALGPQMVAPSQIPKDCPHPASVPPADRAEASQPISGTPK